MKSDGSLTILGEILTPDFFLVERIFGPLGFARSETYLSVVENHMILAASSDGGEAKCMKAFHNLVVAAESYELPRFHQYLKKVKTRLEW